MAVDLIQDKHLPEVKIGLLKTTKYQQTRYANFYYGTDCCSLFILITGIINIILGAMSIHYDFLRVLLNERTRLRPGLIPFEMWRSPPIDIYVKVHIFAAENPDEFLNDGAKLKLKEFGPIILREIMLQKDIVFHQNDTMSYSTYRNCEFVPELNRPGILNESILIPNGLMLGIAGYMQEYTFLEKTVFNLFATTDNVFINTTAYHILFDFQSPIFNLIKKILPFMLPRQSAAMLPNLYFPIERRFNVNIGPNRGYDRFFKINSFNDRNIIPEASYEEAKRCPNVCLEYATDGTNLPPFMTKDTVLNLWREGISSIFRLEVAGDVKERGLQLYKFQPPKNVFDRNFSQCNGQIGSTILPDGFLDISKALFGYPAAMSFPHFLHRPGRFLDRLEGLSPNPEKHESYLKVEPTTGIPIEIAGRMQINVMLPKLTGYTKEVETFSEMVLPAVWIEYTTQDPPSDIIFLINFVVNYLPNVQSIFILVMFISGISLIYWSFLKILRYRRWKRLSRESSVKSQQSITTDRSVTAAVVAGDNCC